MLGNKTYAELLELRNQITDEMASREAAALKRLKLGYEAHGFTLKAGRKSRKLSHPSILATNLIELGVPADELYTTSIVGIPAIEKLVKKYNCTINLEDAIETTEGQPSVVFTG